MEIQIAEIGNMSQSGSSLLKSIQNNSTPILDLLVRESIQNSLDAAKPGKAWVGVEFEIGEFSPKKLNSYLSGSIDTLNARFPNSSEKYIAIRDINTEGLTGHLSSRELKQSDSYGNLLKLVYEIGQSQEAKGAGGSWGLGKTVYFRIGIGLVFYYSRIRLDSGRYQSRLAVTHVEDETKPELSIIPYSSDGKRRGIAWWGQRNLKYPKETIPLTDENEINKILDIFGFEPYEGTETGTSIIIPYINEEKLLKNNRIEYTDNLSQISNPNWYSSLYEYLIIAIQRWYAPKIGNRNLDSVFLKPSVSDRSEKEFLEITSDNMEPAFKVVQDLYTIAYKKLRDRAYRSDLELRGIPTVCEEVLLNGVFTTGSKRASGAIAFANVTETFLHMGPPDNNYSPYYYYGLPDDGDDSSLPVIAYTRKPGMIVEYADSGKWVQGMPPTTDSTYLIGVFVLHSEQRFKNSFGFPDDENSLEDYVRSTENADHMKWEDVSYYGQALKVIQNTQKGVVKKVLKSCKTSIPTVAEIQDKKLSSDLGQFLLPPVGFGTDPRQKASGTNKNSANVKPSSSRGPQFKVEGVSYSSQGMTVTLSLTFQKDAMAFGHMPQ